MTPDRYNILKMIIEEGILEARFDTGEILKNGEPAKLKMWGPYWCVTARGEAYSVHQVIMVAAGHNTIGLDINHKNGNKLDNRLINLELLTHNENIAHAVRMGLTKRERKDTPANDPVKRQQIIDLYLKGHSIVDISRKYICGELIIRNILRLEGIEVKKGRRKTMRDY